MDADQALARATRLYDKLTQRRPEIEELDEYAQGKQPLVFASKEWAEFHRDRYKGFSDNWCAPVASAPSERIAINGIQIKGAKRAARTLWDDWLANDGDAKSSQGFLESITAKRSFTIVWGNGDDEPEFTWEHPAQVIVDYYAGSGRKRDALKAWVEDGVEYMTYYEPEALWKWSRKSGVKVTNGVTENGLTVVGTSTRMIDTGESWDAYQPPEDDVWPVPNPLGEVNVVEWPNRPLLGGEPVSDIAGTKAMQDAVNLLWAYLFGAADYASMPGRVVMGTERPKMPVLDANGQKVGDRDVDIKDLQKGRFLWLTGQNAKIAEFAPAKLDVFTEVIEHAVGHIAAQTRTPSHYLINSTNVPAAGYELAEAGLVEKVKEFHLFSNAPARDHFRLMAKVRDDARAAAAIRTMTPSWADAGVRSDAQQADALLKKRQMGYPLEWLAREDGLSPTEVAELMEMVRRELADPYLSQLSAKDAADADADPASLGN